MIAFTLQKWLKVSFTFSVVAKLCGISNDSYYVTQMTWSVFSFFPCRKIPWFAFEKNCLVSDSRHVFSTLFSFKLQAHFLWIGDSHKIVSFRTQGALFSDFFSFKPQAEFFKLGLNVEFEHRIVKFWTPDDAHFWLK